MVLAPRERDVEYDADHHDWPLGDPDQRGRSAKNFKIVTAPTGVDLAQGWKDWIGTRDDVFIDGFELFDGFTAIAERSDGLERVRVLANDGKSEHVKADEPAYSMGLSVNAEPDTEWLRYSYTSMTTPNTTYELNTRTGERKLLKRDPVPGYDPTQYVTERLWATARDGTKVPVSLVYRKGFKKDGTAALLQYGYGSYGASMDPGFSNATVSLLDRGMVYAIAHIRGGQEMGRAWYDDGKLFKKKNTFTDFIDVTDYLVKEGYAAKDRVAAHGGSAGGLLMGAIGNMAPDRYRVILTASAVRRRGHDHARRQHPADHQRIRRVGQPGKEGVLRLHAVVLARTTTSARRPIRRCSSAPACGIRRCSTTNRPNTWRKLRDINTGGRPVVFRTNMDAGHGGKSGRFRRHKERAEMYAFMLDQLGLSKAP